MILGSHTRLLVKLIQDSLTKDLKPREPLAFAIWLSENMGQMMDDLGLRSDTAHVSNVSEELDLRWLSLIRAGYTVYQRNLPGDEMLA